MKKVIFSCLLSVLIISATNAQYGTVRTGYEGDYFSLEGAVDLFRQSNTLRDFERRINTEENWVNNLDLNYDGRIDYIRVEHRRRGNYHAIILQALLDRYDLQDVAVIEIEVIRRGEAILQIVGDEVLYGEEVIVEPVQGYADSRSGYHSEYGDYVNVYYWRPVQYLLGRDYHVYVSPYRWQYYPTWWRPWRQVTWNIFRPRIVVYHRHFHVVHRHRIIHVHNFYRPYRTYSNQVVVRTNKVRVRQGRAPIHRPRVDRSTYGQRDRSNQVERGPRNVTRSSTTVRRPSDNGRTATPSASRKSTERSSPRVNSSTRSNTSRQRTAPSASPSRKRSATSSSSPSVRQKTTRSSSSWVSPSSRSNTSRQRATPSTSPSRNRSATSRSSSSAREKTTRSSSSRVSPSSRSNTSRQRATPSTSPSRNRSATSRSSSSAREKTTRSSSSRVSPSSRSNTSRQRATPSTSPSWNRSATSRSSSSAREKTTRSSSSRVSPSSRSNTSRQRATRSASPSRKKSSGSSRSSSSRRKSGGDSVPEA